jgi:hypothetical protein
LIHDLHKFLILIFQLLLQEFRLFEIVLLILLFILSFAAERHAIDWVLGRFFVENVPVPIVPIRVASLIYSYFLDWAFIKLCFAFDWGDFNTLLALVVLFGYGLVLHWVWVDDFSFLFQIECVFVVLCMRWLLYVLLIVGRIHVCRVGVSNKTIGAPRVLARAVAHI